MFAKDSSRTLSTLPLLPRNARFYELKGLRERARLGSRPNSRKSPSDARALLIRVTNLMIAGERKDENYRLAMEVWELQMADWERNKRVGPAPAKPQPPKLEPKVVTATANAVRTWLDCKDSELEALLKEVQETNQKLLDIESKQRQQGGRGQQH
jgi:hypothetical protein